MLANALFLCKPLEVTQCEKWGKPNAELIGIIIETIIHDLNNENFFQLIHAQLSDGTFNGLCYKRGSRVQELRKNYPQK